MSSSEDYLDSLLANALQENNDNESGGEESAPISVSTETASTNDDPNHVMTPDEIAALINNMESGDSNNSDESNAEEDKSNELIVEEKAADLTRFGEKDEVEESISDALASNKADKKDGSIKDSLAANILGSDDIDSQSDELMALLQEGAGDEDDDEEEEDIEEMLRAAEREGLSDAAKAGLMGLTLTEEAMDVTDFVDQGNGDAEADEIADLLKMSDNGQLVDRASLPTESGMDDFMNGEEENSASTQSGGAMQASEEEGEEESDGKKKKKKKKKGLFGKNKDEDEAVEEMAEDGEKPKSKKKKKNKKNKNNEDSVSSEGEEKGGLFSFFKKGKKESKADSDAETGTDKNSSGDVMMLPPSDIDFGVFDLGENTELPNNGSSLAGSEAAGDSIDLFGSELAGGDADDTTVAKGGSGGGISSAGGSKEDDAADKNGKKEKKKGGLFSKLFELLTEEVEDEENDIPEKNATKVSEENLQILSDLDDEEGGKGKKGKKKKEKKKKEKKPKKAKPKKPKKEKPVEENDGKHIPKKHIMRTALLAISILAVLLLLCLFLPEKLVVGEGRDAYYQQDYKNTFLAMYGKKLNDSDQLIYDRSKMIVILDRKYEAYENFKIMDMPVEALNALIQGIDRYNKNIKRGEELDIMDQLNAIRDKIANALMSDYGITVQDAEEMLEYNDLDYSNRLNSIVDGTPFMKSEDAVREAYGLPPKNGATTDIDVIEENLGENENPDELPDLLPEEIEYQHQLENEAMIGNDQSNNQSKPAQVGGAVGGNGQQVELQIDSTIFNN